MSRKRYNDALREALIEEMNRDENVMLLGEDIGIYGGAFKVTDGLYDQFGEERVLDTPISEQAITGVSIGAAIAGKRPVCEMMYIDWIGLTLDQLVNQAAMLHYVYDGQVKIPMVMRTQGGAGASACAQHSKSLESWMCHIPGLKVVMPSNAYDAKGLLKSAIRDDNPVIFIEHKLLYGTRSEIPDEEYLIELGKAKVKKEGTDITIIAMSAMVLEAMSAAKELEKEGISCEVIDPRTLVPLDKETIYESVSKTNKVIIVSESWKTGSYTGEISALLAEEMFDYLDAPVYRLNALDTHIPYSPALEPLVIPNKDKIVAAAKKMLLE